MTQSLGHQNTEIRLQRRAQALGEVPLLDSPRTADLQDEMRANAHREAFSAARRQRVSFVFGLVAAALLLLAVPQYFALRKLNFGDVPSEVALLDSGGRVLDSASQLRSGDPNGAHKPAQPLYVEVFVENSAFLSVHMRTNEGWSALPEYDSVELQGGEDVLIQLPEHAPPLSVLIVSSERPIPAQVLEQNLRRFGWEALPARLGCSVELRRVLGPAEQGAANE